MIRMTAEWLKTLPEKVRLSDGSTAKPGAYELKREWKGDFLSASLTNRSREALRVREAVLMGGVFPVPPACRFYGEGFQMLTQYEGTLAEPQVIGKYGSDESFFHIPKTSFNADRFTVYNCLLLSPAAHSHALFAFTSSFRYVGEFRFKGNDIEIVADCEDRVLAPGETWVFDEFGVFTGEDVNALFERLADRLNRNHPPLRYPEVPFGWCSYHCISGVRAEEMYEQARALKARIPSLRRIQIDAGYQSSSDWLIPNPASGATMKEMCEKIRALGVEPAGYLSPFLVEADSALMRDHSDWVVHGADGRPFNEYTHVPHWYMLDGSNPEAVDYIRHVVRVMHDEWGLRYFKLDFTSYGALPGGARHGGMTRVEAFRALFGAIAEEVGADSYILGCNAPFWPQLGLVHGNRATNDVFRRWETVSGNARQLFWRGWQSRLWLNDPDGVVLEKRDMSGYRGGRYRRRICELSDAEFRFHRAYIMACGGVVTSGDLLTEISGENIKVLETLMRNVGPAAVFDDDTFTVGRAVRADGELICAFNWSDDVRCIEIPVERPCRATELFSGRDLGAFEKYVMLDDVLPHDGMVIRLEPTGE
ncbi:MAG: alpha-galactosidase [Clostridia bacterium]|nr:alpha-galactosidase [Clostridia bacterium]